MHTFETVAFILFVAAALCSVSNRADISRWAFTFLACGLAAVLVPAVFELTSS